jgi:hypothetical protein
LSLSRSRKAESVNVIRIKKKQIVKPRPVSELRSRSKKGRNSDMGTTMISFVSKSRRSKKNRRRLPSLKLSFDLDSGIPGLTSFSSQPSRGGHSHYSSNYEFFPIHEERHRKVSNKISETSSSAFSKKKFKVSTILIIT